MVFNWPPWRAKFLLKLCDVEQSLLSDRVAKSVAENIIRGIAATVLSSPEAVTRAAKEGSPAGGVRHPDDHVVASGCTY
jgi:hypothetical protein